MFITWTPNNTTAGRAFQISRGVFSGMIGGATDFWTLIVPTEATSWSLMGPSQSATWTLITPTESTIWTLIEP